MKQQEIERGKECIIEKERMKESKREKREKERL